LTLSALFDTAAVFLIYKTLEKLAKPNVGFWAAAFYLFNPFGLQFSMSGLETGLNNFLLALLVYLSVKASPDWLRTNWFYLGVVAGVTLLSRTDNVLIVITLLVYLFWQNRRVVVLKTVLLAVILVLPWFIYNMATFGTIIQTSGQTFPWLYHQQYLNEHKSYLSLALIPYALKSGFYNLALYLYHYGNWVLTFILLAVLLYRLKAILNHFVRFCGR
jgi:hypothetical protein